MTGTAADREFAPAKINLALHVTGRRADGYHLLDSLVTFAGVGDVISLRPSQGAALEIVGAEARGLSAGADNLVLRAAHLAGLPPGQGLALEKRLPVASGIGGGSADAAATLRLLARQGGILPGPDAVLGLGADVPVCLAGQTCRMSGIGEQLTPVAALPPVWALLVNPRVGVSTPAVFRALEQKENPPLPERIGPFRDLEDLIVWLAGQRNDLEEPAIALAPQIGEALDALEDLPGALFARMSGSGATCFALFERRIEAERACYEMQDSFPDWWVAAAPLGDAAAVSSGL